VVLAVAVAVLVVALERAGLELLVKEIMAEVVVTIRAAVVAVPVR
jgi:hypothetical protein